MHKIKSNWKRIEKLFINHIKRKLSDQYIEIGPQNAEYFKRNSLSKLCLKMMTSFLSSVQKIQAKNWWSLNVFNKNHQNLQSKKKSNNCCLRNKCAKQHWPTKTVMFDTFQINIHNTKNLYIEYNISVVSNILNKFCPTEIFVW